MSKIIVESAPHDQDIGLLEITFIVDGKRYRVTPKKGVPEGKLNAFHKYLRSAEKSGNNPFWWKSGGKSSKDYFDIETLKPSGASKPAEKKDTVPEEGIQTQLKLAAAHIDSLANQLEAKGFIREARDLDVLSNTLESGWEDNAATLFWDEALTLDLSREDIKKIIDAYEDGADTEHSVSKVTKLPAWSCKKVLDIAHKHDLLNKGS